MLVLLFVALWFILRGDLLYVFPCAILFLCFSVLLVLRLPCLGKRELILVLFVRLFDLCLFGFVGFLFLLGSGKGCGLWLWHSLDFSLTFLCYQFGFLWYPWLDEFIGKSERPIFVQWLLPHSLCQSTYHFFTGLWYEYPCKSHFILEKGEVYRGKRLSYFCSIFWVLVRTTFIIFFLVKIAILPASKIALPLTGVLL